MLGYDWSSHSPPPPTTHPTHPPQLILPDDLHHHHHHHHDPSTQHNHHRPIFDDPFNTTCTFPHDNTPPHHHHHHHFHHQLNTHTTTPLFPSLYDPTSSSFPSSSSFNPLQPPPNHHHHNNLLQHDYSILVPKPDPEFPNRIGLNLGGRTYFASDDDLVSRLYRRTRGGDQLVNTPKCQAEGCNADLTHAKHYHRRHKVCEFHSKSSTVVAAGLTQRFCQQCSRFHLLSEFDNGKRSCRKRLADHNRRRRKSHQIANRDQRDPDQHVPPTSPSQSIQRSTSDSGANSSSSVTVAISSPLASFDSNFRQRSYD